MLETIDRVFHVAIYIRLSKEDEQKKNNESESVTNQKALLTEYVLKLGPGYKIEDIYIDDGYTGTNFDRPNFKRMIKDIEFGKINMVVVKDLSRLSRDHVGAGEYIEKWFPLHNVKFVSVNDAIDTSDINNGNNYIAPIKSWVADMTSYETSNKIKASLHIMQKQGKWVGGKTSFGYIKSPENKNQLIICEEEAEIVRTIFNMAYSGKQIGEIRNYLNENNIPTSSQIRYNKATFWENKAIKNILTNPVYIGTTIQNKISRISYKVRKLRKNPKAEWYIVENTHEPIIDKNIFEAVQKMTIAQKYSRNEKKNNFLLDGLLVCYECKHKIGVRKDKKKKHSMICNNYRRYSKSGVCTSHGFNYEDLENMVLEYIRNIFTKINTGKIETSIEKNKPHIDYKKLLKKIDIEVNQLKRDIEKMYIEKLEEKINEEMYESLYEKFKNDIDKKQIQYNEIQEEMKNIEQDDTKQMKNIIEEFLKLEKPTPEIMRIIINRIEIHQDRQVDIVFNFKKLNYLENKRCLF